MPKHDSDQDPVWNLIDQARPREASPLFARKVLREIRLAEAKPLPWWRRSVPAIPLAIGSFAAAAVVALLLSLTAPPDQGDHPTKLADTTPPSSASPGSSAAFNQAFERELLIAAAEDPSLFSDEQLLALLY